MADIFRSKEVYKHIPREEYGEEKIIPVQGVYVAGEYRPPYYAEPGIAIISFDTTNPTVVDYTDDVINVDAGPTVVVFDMKSTFSFDSIRYTTEDSGSTPSPTAVVFDVRSPAFNFGCSRYETEYVNATSSPTTVAFDIRSPGFSLGCTRQDKVSTQFSPDAAVTLESITSDPATISNL